MLNMQLVLRHIVHFVHITGCLICSMFNMYTLHIFIHIDLYLDVNTATYYFAYFAYCNVRYVQYRPLQFSLHIDLHIMHIYIYICNIIVCNTFD
jgi:hypothetical protein